jgi:hypothetical protein
MPPTIAETAGSSCVPASASRESMSSEILVGGTPCTEEWCVKDQIAITLHCEEIEGANKSSPLVRSAQWLAQTLPSRFPPGTFSSQARALPPDLP